MSDIWFENGKWNRKCKECGETVSHTMRNNCYASNRDGCLCRKCTDNNNVKQLDGIWFEKGKWSRKCKDCGKTMRYQCRNSCYTAEKAERVCRKCFFKDFVVFMVDGKPYSKHPLYYTHNAMLYRCYNPKSTAYKNYGGRGIKVCDEWKNSRVSYVKWCLANGYKKGLQLDRINNDGNYEPSNCRFVTPKENSSNRRRKSKIKV